MATEAKIEADPMLMTSTQLLLHCGVPIRDIARNEFFPRTVENHETPSESTHSIDTLQLIEEIAARSKATASNPLFVPNISIAPATIQSITTETSETIAILATFDTSGAAGIDIVKIQTSDEEFENDSFHSAMDEQPAASQL